MVIEGPERPARARSKGPEGHVRSAGFTVRWLGNTEPKLLSFFFFLKKSLAFPAETLENTHNITIEI